MKPQVILDYCNEISRRPELMRFPKWAAEYIIDKVGECSTLAAAKEKLTALVDAVSHGMAAARAFADSAAVQRELSRFPRPVRDSITSRLRDCISPSEAALRLRELIAVADSAAVAGKLAGTSYDATSWGGAAPAEPRVNVGPDRQYMAVVDKLLAAFDSHRRLIGRPAPDPAAVAKTRKLFTSKFLPDFEKRYGQALAESAAALLDAERKSGPIGVPRPESLRRAFADSQLPIADAASITSSNLANQPALSLAIQIERFQQSLAMLTAPVLGPDAFVSGAGVSSPGIGSVLRIPTETYTPPAANVEPNIGDELLGAEDGEIPEARVDLRFQDFAPRWNRLAFSISTEAQQALANGPLDYDAIARGLFHVTEHSARVIDQAYLREVIQATDEFGKVAVSSEVATTGDANLTYGAGGSQGGYGANVVLVVKLRRGGTIAAPRTERPAVRTRISKKLDADGFMTSTTINPASVGSAVGFVITDRQGYVGIGSDGLKQVQGTVGGLAATWALDWEAGNFVATSVFGWDNGVADNFAISYTYATNLDTWVKTVPPGSLAAEYYDLLLEQLDKTAAKIFGSPNFAGVDLALMSYTASVLFANARIFHKAASPKGSTLDDPDFQSLRAVFATRNGIGLLRHNIPWQLADDRVIVGQRAATKIGIDTAPRVVGPFQRYGPNQKLIAGQSYFVEENVVVATPLVLDPVTQAVRQGYYRSIRFLP